MKTAAVVAILLAPAVAWAPQAARTARRGCVSMKSKNPPTYKKKTAVSFKKGWKIEKWAQDADGYLTQDGMETGYVPGGTTSAAPSAAVASAPSVKPGAVESSPETMELFVKAGAAGDDVGDCPFSHAVRMVLEAKGIAHTCTPVAAGSKPAWLESEFGGVMPVLIHDGEKYSDSVEIAKYLDFFFREPPLAAADAATDALVAPAKAFFGALKGYITADSADANDVANKELEFDSACSKLDKALSKAGGPLAAGGDKLSVADCVLAPMVHHATIALPKMRGAAIDAKHKALCAYAGAMAELPAFKATAPSEASVLWGWEQATA